MIKLKHLVVSAYFLTLADCFCTAAGVRAKVITEANPLLQSAMQTCPILTALGIGAGVFGLLAVVYHFGPRARCTVPLLTLLCVVKLAVVGLHVRWIGLVLFGM
ncbi:MAG: DUF5658 family protein [Oscillospiraceae bacterium]